MPIEGDKYPKEKDTKEIVTLNSAQHRVDNLSPLGTPIFSDLIFEISDKEALRIIDAIIVVSKSKTIVKSILLSKVANTTVEGLFKEYISAGDYNISIKGSIASDVQNSYPIELMKQLIAVSKLKVVSVVCPYLQLFDINDIVIEDIEWPQEEAQQGIQYFTISAVSEFTPQQEDNRR
jgi:hypothetical protein